MLDERYLMQRASSLSYDLFQTMSEFSFSGLLILFPFNPYSLICFLGSSLSQSEKEAMIQRILFDIAYTAGKQDAFNLMNKMALEKGSEMLSTGAIHYSYAGNLSIIKSHYLLAC